jgi:flavin reductase (DIM6/NTAB) family NADH-FMN oxidoreductase RutF
LTWRRRQLLTQARTGLARCPRDPTVDECHVNLECVVVDTRGVNRYCFFVLEVQQAWVERAHEDPPTLHHRGMGAFMVAGPTIRLRSNMR